jgi:DNA-binding NtrC family response regulator
MGRSAKSAGLPARDIGEDAMAALQAYEWPGNVRQLRNVIESAVVFCQGEEITPADLPVEVRESSTISTSGTPVQVAAGEPRSMADIERHAILETLERTSGHRAKAADLLGIGLRTLQRKLKEYKDEGYIQED